MTGADSRETSPTNPPARRSWRRRQFVVDARYQLRAGILVGSVAVALLVLLNISLMGQNPPPSGAVGTAPPGSAEMSRPDRASWALILLGSGVFLTGVIAIGVLESHRTAGAAYAIRRGIDQIREGRTGVRVKLRRGDHLQELARALNQLAESLDAERSGRG